MSVSVKYPTVLLKKRIWLSGKVFIRVPLNVIIGDGNIMNSKCKQDPVKSEEIQEQMSDDDFADGTLACGCQVMQCDC